MKNEFPEHIRVLAIIPARGGSKGIPRKNIADLAGKPLIAYAIQASMAAQKVDAVLVSTDDTEIAEVARTYGADVPFLRPEELAQDHSRDIDMLTHVLDWVRAERGWNPEMIVLLPPTSPSRTSEDIDAVIELMDSTGADSVRTVVHPPHWNPYKMWRSTGDHEKIVPIMPEGLQGIPRQELPTYYMPVGIAYAMRPHIIQTGELWGDDVRMLEIPLSRYTDIDTAEDLIEAEHIMRTQNII